MTAITRRGQPLPYKLEARGEPLTQYAIIECSYCDKEGQFRWPNYNTQNPITICQKFVRMGWEIYKSSKKRCPECVTARTRQKATHARLDEEREAMQTIDRTKEMIKLVKPAPATRRDQTFLITIDGATGEASIRALDGAIEMLFGDKTYLVLPFTETDSET